MLSVIAVQLLIIILTKTILILLISLSFCTIYRTSSWFLVSHAISLVLGSYIFYFFNIQLNMRVLWSFLTSAICVIFLTLIFFLFVFRQLEKHRIQGWQMLIASLGVYVVLQNVVSIVWGDNTLSLRTWPVKEGHQVFGAYISNVQIITIGTSLTLVTLSWMFLEKTNIGQNIKAVSSNPELARIMGISKEKAVFWSFIIGSGLAVCAGILIAADTDMTPTMGFNWLLYGVVAMIIGGMGKLRYLVLGALLLATVQHLAAYFLDSKWMNATAYILLIAFLYFRPYGFSGESLKKVKI